MIYVLGMHLNSLTHSLRSPIRAEFDERERNARERERGEFVNNSVSIAIKPADAAVGSKTPKQ